VRAAPRIRYDEGVRSWGFIGVGAVALASCNVLTGADSVRYGDTLAGAVEAGAPSGPAEGGLPPIVDDAGVDITVDPTLTRCGEDLVCVPHEKGWVPVVTPLVSISTSCPMGWPTQRIAKTSGGGGCGCNCQSTAGSCAGPIQVRSGSGCTGPLSTVTPAATCTSGGTYTSPSSFTLVPPSPPTACAGTPVDAHAPPGDTFACEGALPIASDACKRGEDCVARPATSPFPFRMCIAHVGEVTCPLMMGNRVVIGSAVNDQRRCGETCKCKPKACSGLEITAYDDAACQELARSIRVDGSCTNHGAGAAVAYRITTPATGCEADVEPEELGSETVSDPITLCCSLGL